MIVAFGVPVKVTVAGEFGQMLTLPAMEAVGGGTTEITTVPVSGRVQLGVPCDVTPVRVKVVVAV